MKTEGNMNGRVREPERISRILDWLKEIWETNPDMRFFQLVNTLEHDYSLKHNGFGKRQGFEIDERNYKNPITFIDLFYLADEILEKFLQEYINDQRSRK